MEIARIEEFDYEDEEEDRTPLKEDSPKRSSNSFCIISMIISYMFSSIAVSVINPFFPLYVVTRGGSNILAGLIIATVWIPQLLLFPILCDVVLTYGVKTAFVMGNFIFAITTILFAFTDLVETYAVFLILCFLIKFIQGFGMAFIKTSSVCIVSRFIPEKSTSILGLLETGSAVGFIIGPIIGGFMYDKLGFKSSIIIPGIMLALVFILSIASMHRGMVFAEDQESTPQQSKESISYHLAELCKFVSPYILAVSCFFSFCIPCLYDIMYPMYGTEHAFLKPSTIGVILLLFAIPDCISTLISGHFMERIGNGRRVLFSGTVVNAFGFLIIALFGIFGILNYYTLAILIVIQTAVTSLMLVPVFKIMKEVAFENGLRLDNDMNVAISNIIVTSAMAGQVIGNASSGILFDALGVKYSSLMLFILFLILIILQLRFIKPQNEPSETTRLLQQ